MATTVLADDLDPSEGHSLEPELAGPPPRPIPDRLLAEGPYARDRRRAVVLLALAGALCLLASRTPGLDAVAQYVLFLVWLPWIGLALLVLAAVLYLPLARHGGRFRYVREGLPVAARVLDLLKTPAATHQGTPVSHVFVATIAFRHPDTGDVVQAQVRSEDFSSSRKDAYDTPFKVGDTVTAVYLPGRLETTLRLYPFLELSPDAHLRAGAPASSQPWKAALLILAVAAFFAVLLGNLYAFGRYQPISFEYGRAAVPLAAGALVLGGALLAGVYLGHRSEERRILERSRRAAAEGRAVETAPPFLGGGLQGGVLRALLAVGAPLMGAVTALCWAFMANAWLDRSPVRPVPATIVARTATTHALVLREYELEYTIEGHAGTQSLLTTPGHLARLSQREAVAHVRQGRLGWPWVETVTPR